MELNYSVSETWEICSFVPGSRLKDFCREVIWEIRELSYYGCADPSLFRVLHPPTSPGFDVSNEHLVEHLTFCARLQADLLVFLHQAKARSTLPSSFLVFPFRVPFRLTTDIDGARQIPLTKMGLLGFRRGAPFCVIFCVVLTEHSVGGS